VGLSGVIERESGRQCSHETSGEGVWYVGDEGVFRPTPVCCKCGTLKNVSIDRGKGIGFYINILAEMRRRLEKETFKVSDSQIRLIINEIKKADGFDDTYWIRGSIQKSIFIKSVQKYSTLSTAFIESFL